MGDVAFASGFASIRAFNDTVREIFALSPTELRRRAARGQSAAPVAKAGRVFKDGVRVNGTARKLGK